MDEEIADLHSLALREELWSFPIFQQEFPQPPDQELDVRLLPLCWCWRFFETGLR